MPRFGGYDSLVYREQNERSIKHEISCINSALNILNFRPAVELS